MIIANLSGGRDSSAMVVKWLELGNKLDYIIFCDTGFEFKEMYKYIEKLDLYLQREFNKSITYLNKGGKENLNDCSTILETWAFHKPITKGDKKGLKRGLPKVLGLSYCTRESKANPTKRFVQERVKNKWLVTCLIGYTYNEVEEGRVSNLDYAITQYPLHEWGVE